MTVCGICGEQLGTWHRHLPKIGGQRARILTLARNGFTNRQIADELSISEDTVRTHFRRMCRQLGVDRQGAIRAVQEGRVLLDPE